MQSKHVPLTGFYVADSGGFYYDRQLNKTSYSLSKLSKIIFNLLPAASPPPYSLNFSLYDSPELLVRKNAFNAQISIYLSVFFSIIFTDITLQFLLFQHISVKPYTMF